MSPKRYFIDLTETSNNPTRKKQKVSRDERSSHPFDTESSCAVRKASTTSRSTSRPVDAAKSAKLCAVAEDEIATSGQGDQLHLDKDSKINKVCFGSLCNLRVRISSDVEKLTKSGLITGTIDTNKLELTKDFGQHAICYNSEVIVVMSTKTSEVCSILERFPTVHYSIDTQSVALAEWVSAWQKNRKTPDLNLEIILSGDTGIKDSLGDRLSEARLYLQPPRSLPDGMILENPHIIDFTDLEDEDDEQLNSIETNRSTTDSLRTQGMDASVLLEGLDHHEYLNSDTVISKLETNLLNHQHQAVNFILERESGDSTIQSLSLWKPSGTSMDLQKHFVHKVTKRVSTQPKEALGGIVADEMGLGKTLTMLAGIASSQEDARKFTHSFKPTNAARLCSRATLVVVPSTLLLDNWIAETIRHFAPDTLTVYRFYGPQRENDPTKLLDFNIVITTYATLVAQFSGNHPLHSISWYRIVLDEAHEIRNQSSRAFRAVASLNGKIRWCLTGTPIQNRLEDLGSLVRFLQVPFLSTPRDYKTYCINPVLSKQAEGFGNIRTLLQTICIRRTKELLELPKFKTIEHRLTLSKDERTQYRDITRAYKTAIDDAISGRKPADAYRSIFQALLDLRLLCNHGSRDLSIKRETDDFMALFQEGPILCAYCESKLSVENPSEQTPAAIISSCSHIVCSECLDKVRGDMKRLESGSKVKCPSCSKRMLSEAGSPVIRFGTNSEPEDSDDSICSTKFAKIIEDISKHSSTEKCIVFSYWKQTLARLARALEKQQIPFVVLDGSLSLTQRRVVLNTFHQDVNTPVLLMTLGTGAVGLNLTIASRIHLIEPQWNPTVESQAIGRALRFGQEKQVTIVRYIMRNTVEEYIQTRQRHKLQLANLGLSAGGKTTTEDNLEKVKDLRETIGL